MSSSEISDLSDSAPEDEMINNEIFPTVHPHQAPYFLYKSLDLSTIEVDDEVDKMTLIIAAVVQNNVTFLMDLLENDFEETDYFKMINESDGNNLLQIAVIHENTEAFDYLLSLGNFPLEHTNNEGENALTLALYGTATFGDHAAYELIRKGASLHSLPNLFLEYGGESLLHFVIGRSFVQVAMLLMEMGHNVNDLNESGFSLLWYCLDEGFSYKIETEVVSALLTYGADPTVGKKYGFNMYEYAVKFCSPMVLEQFFYYFFDEYTKMDVHFEVLLTLAEEQSQFFYETVEHTDQVVLGVSSYNYYYLLFCIKTEYLKKLIEKCGDVIRQVLIHVQQDDYRLLGICDKLVFDNVNALLESDFRCDVINFIVDLSDKFYFNFLIGCDCAEYLVLERLCFLLSYGLIITESNLQLFYKKYGHGELLRILLHMDIEVNICKRYIRDVMLLFLYDVTLDLDKYLKNYRQYSLRNVRQLLHHFVHPRLKVLCSQVTQDDYVTEVVDQPDVPLLVELARNTFRKFFVDVFNIKNAKQFYSLLNGLPISVVHKKIITFETRLY